MTGGGGSRRTPPSSTAQRAVPIAMSGGRTQLMTSCVICHSQDFFRSLFGFLLRVIDGDDNGKDFAPRRFLTANVALFCSVIGRADAVEVNIPAVTVTVPRPTIVVPHPEITRPNIPHVEITRPAVTHPYLSGDSSRRTFAAPPKGEHRFAAETKEDLSPRRTFVAPPSINSVRIVSKGEHRYGVETKIFSPAVKFSSSLPKNRDHDHSGDPPPAPPPAPPPPPAQAQGNGDSGSENITNAPSDLAQGAYTFDGATSVVTGTMLEVDCQWYFSPDSPPGGTSAKYPVKFDHDASGVWKLSFAPVPGVKGRRRPSRSTLRNWGLPPPLPIRSRETTPARPASDPPRQHTLTRRSRQIRPPTRERRQYRPRRSRPAISFQKKTRDQAVWAHTKYVWEKRARRGPAMRELVSRLRSVPLGLARPRLSDIVEACPWRIADTSGESGDGPFCRIIAVDAVILHQGARVLEGSIYRERKVRAISRSAGKVS